ncbi:P-loop ATPase, Sll1717 family [Pseudomonas lundensis]|uniref:P-loop ATPase, Sll1717 family n=1 Tax=Pseudomonas lundensis TaxID=86185 RepID=UPI000641D04B|nr:hypothetical protein [Pseudomonas lundensis]
MTFEQYYQSLGLAKYPFSVYTSEAESDFFNAIYLKPQNHSIILEGLKNTSSIIIGERGTGKTALSIDFAEILSTPKNLIVRIEEFSSLELEYDQNKLYKFFLERLVSEFFNYHADKPSSLWKYSKEDRIDLSMFLHEYLGASTRELLKDKVSKIQNGLIKRVSLGAYNSLRSILNYGLKATTKVISDTITQHFSSLPPFEGTSAEYFQRLNIEIDTSFEANQQQYFYLERFCRLIRKSGFSKIYIFIDKIDEDPRFHNDAEDISAFMSPIASDNKLLTSSLFHTVLFVWSTPFNYIKDRVRTQKLCLTSLSWDRNELEKVLDKRLLSYSSPGVDTPINIFDNCSIDRVDLIFNMCNRNPRDLWHILNKSFEEQFKINPNSSPTDQAIDAAIRRFVVEFNYYEYYPRKSNAKANSMDIYRYIKHLQKLDNPKFTKDKLNVVAGTGSSTSNYVVSMENMGLIKRTSEKAQGGAVIYEIADPKVCFAMLNNIEVAA